MRYSSACRSTSIIIIYWTVPATTSRPPYSRYLLHTRLQRNTEPHTCIKIYTASTRCHPTPIETYSRPFHHLPSALFLEIADTPSPPCCTITRSRSTDTIPSSQASRTARYPPRYSASTYSNLAGRLSSCLLPRVVVS